MSDTAEAALDALAFLEAIIAGNRTNWKWTLDNICGDALLVGMTAVGRSLLLSLATEHGHDYTAEVALQRAMFLQDAGDPA